MFLQLRRALAHLMPWFPVDDSFHSHPKVLATSPAALGLWALAGSWSSATPTDGFVPDHVLPRLLPDSAKLANELVARGLWERCRGGYVFHDWFDWGSKRSAKEVQDLRRKRAEAGRKGGVASGKTRSKPRSKAEANASRLLQPQSSPSSTADLIIQAAGSWALVSDDDPILRSVIDSIYRRTSRVLVAAEARVIAAGILAGRKASDPAAYVARAIAQDPDPQRRWLDGLSDVPALSAPWCGNCDEATRLIDPDSPRRCPKCHPLRDES